MCPIPSLLDLTIENIITLSLNKQTCIPKEAIEFVISKKNKGMEPTKENIEREVKVGIEYNLMIIKERRRWKAFKNMYILPWIDQGLKLVAIDEYGPCLNCYYYGNNRACLSHRNSELDHWLSFYEYYELCAPEMRPIEHDFASFERSRRYELEGIPESEYLSGRD